MFWPVLLFAMPIKTETIQLSLQQQRQQKDHMETLGVGKVVCCHFKLLPLAVELILWRYAVSGHFMEQGVFNIFIKVWHLC